MYLDLAAKAKAQGPAPVVAPQAAMSAMVAKKFAEQQQALASPPPAAPPPPPPAPLFAGRPLSELMEFVYGVEFEPLRSPTVASN